METAYVQGVGRARRRRGRLRCRVAVTRGWWSERWPAMAPGVGPHTVMLMPTIIPPRSDM